MNRITKSMSTDGSADGGDVSKMTESQKQKMVLQYKHYIAFTLMEMPVDVALKIQAATLAHKTYLKNEVIRLACIGYERELELSRDK